VGQNKLDRLSLEFFFRLLCYLGIRLKPIQVEDFTVGSLVVLRIVYIGEFFCKIARDSNRDYLPQSPWAKWHKFVLFVTSHCHYHHHCHYHCHCHCHHRTDRSTLKCNTWQKQISRTNTLAYFAWPSPRKRKSFIRFRPSLISNSLLLLIKLIEAP
jgi:hypothetical protein